MNAHSSGGGQVFAPIWCAKWTAFGIYEIEDGVAHWRKARWAELVERNRWRGRVLRVVR